MEVTAEDVRTNSIQEEREKKKKTLTVMSMFLLLLAIILAVLIYLLLPKAPVRKGAFGFLFSIYGLTQPRGVSVADSGDIYVCDTGEGRVLVFDDQGTYKRRIGGLEKPTKVYSVYGTLVDEKAKKVFITDVTARVVHVFSTGGKFLYRFPKYPLTRRNFGYNGFSPFGIDEYKGKLYIASVDGIYIYTKAGKLVRKITGRGKEVKQFNFPNGLAVDKKDGTIYVSDGLNKRIKAITQTGKVKWVLGQPDEKGYIKSFFGMPRGLAIDDRYVYVSDALGNGIAVLKKDGSLVSVIVNRGVDDGQFNFPEGLAMKNGQLYIADRENNRVQVLKVEALPKPDKDKLKKYAETFKSFSK